MISGNILRIRMQKYKNEKEISQMSLFLNLFLKEF